MIFYNVENLFDTIDDPKKNDNEFLPSYKKGWNSQKMFEKISHINQVLDYFDFPALVGFCEIENKKVLELLLQNSNNRKKYGIVHYESEDERGIDVGLIYHTDVFKYFESGYLRFILPQKQKASSRDILWAKFLVKKDTFFVLVNHWPSRIGGKEESNSKRLTAANKAFDFIDSVQRVSPMSRIIFMGDLNDGPKDDAPKLISQRLSPQISEKSGDYGGTHCYKKEWEVLDHIMVSNNLISKSKPKLIGNGKIVSPDFLMENDKESMQPKRTYTGIKYLGGYSDHLPVQISIKL
ncbi:MAG: hypothetical protein HYU67_04750 [Flavobacteriia bacterium]|nr:hypothetical protein [Flavobacteriia bacterium]